MDSIMVCGGKPLFGQVKIQGSKNAVLPLIAAAVLNREVVVLKGCPNISDIDEMLCIFSEIGGKWEKKEDKLILDAGKVDETLEALREAESYIPEKSAGSLRASILFMGALAGRCGHAAMFYPGGCVIGLRPIDMHIQMMRQMGYFYEERDRSFWVTKKSCTIKKNEEIILTLPYSSVGVTENVVLASVLGNAVTTVENVSVEPEVISLCEMLCMAGAKIEGIRTKCLKITGVDSLHHVVYEVPKDRIVAGTYCLAGLATGGIVELTDPPTEQLGALIHVLERAGAMVAEGKNSLTVISPKHRNPVPYLETAIYPGFPTDLQSPLLVAMTQSEGDSLIRETIFENRFKIVESLTKMGAKIDINGDTAAVHGKTELHGKHVYAEELRGGASLVLAGLTAEGRTWIHNIEYMKRGYEDIVRDLRGLGARIALVENVENIEGLETGG